MIGYSHLWSRYYFLISKLTTLWRCWLGGRKGIRPVKNWEVGCWRGYLSGVRCRLAYGPSWCHCHSLSLASVKSRLVLPFWYRLTRVVPDKGPLNGCVCVCFNLMAVFSRIPGLASFHLGPPIPSILKEHLCALVKWDFFDNVLTISIRALKGIKLCQRCR